MRTSGYQTRAGSFQGDALTTVDGLMATEAVAIPGSEVRKIQLFAKLALSLFAQFKIRHFAQPLSHSVCSASFRGRFA